MLEIRDLHVRFHNRDREAVGGISITIGDGEIVGLVGESGSGKTVTAMSIAGLLPRKQCSYSGDILLNGRDLLHAQRSELRKLHGREIGVVDERHGPADEGRRTGRRSPPHSYGFE